MFQKLLHSAVLMASIGCCQVLVAQETVTSIDFYGVRTLSINDLEATIGIASGKPTTLTAKEMKERIMALDGVDEVDLVQIQYPGNLAVFIGIRESGQESAKPRMAPAGAIKLEPELIDRYEEIMKMLIPAIKAGQAGEDRSAGHSISEYPPMKEKQAQLIAIADKRLESLIKVLRESSDEKSRGASAYILAYASDKAKVARALQLGCTDPSSLVRNNAVRALGVLATFAQTNDKADIEIPYQPILQLLKSLKWTDRNKGTALVDALSVGRDQILLDALIEKHLPELEEMARWKSHGHAFFAIRILARLAQLSEDDIRQRAKIAKTHEDRSKWVDELLAGI